MHQICVFRNKEKDGKNVIHAHHHHRFFYLKNCMKIKDDFCLLLKFPFSSLCITQTMQMHLEIYTREKRKKARNINRHKKYESFHPSASLQVAVF